jgi:hypothetical protein
MRHVSISLSVLVGAVLALPACGEQASPGYAGQTLATIEGTLTVHRTGTLPEADIIVAWPDFSQGTTDGQVASTAVYTSVRQPVSATLPAGFRLNLVEPPPATAFAPLPPGWSGPRLTLGQILIVKRGATPKSITSLDPAILQIVDDYLINYVEGTGNLTGPDGHGGTASIPLTKGFTLARQKITFCSSAVDSQCADAYRAQLSAMAVDWVCGTTRDEQTKAVDVPFSTPISIEITDPSAPSVPADLTETCPLPQL